MELLSLKCNYLYMPNEKLAALNEAFGTIKKEFEVIKADLAAPSEEMCSRKEVWAMLDRCMGSVYSMVDNLHAKMNEMDNYNWKQHGDHQKGHAPAFKTATHLQNFLKATGMDKDFDVVKPVIYANTSRGLEVTLDYSVKNGQ